MDGGAWPFLVGGVICLVNSDNERDSPLLNSRLDLELLSCSLPRSRALSFLWRALGSPFGCGVCLVLLCVGSLCGFFALEALLCLFLLRAWMLRSVGRRVVGRVSLALQVRRLTPTQVGCVVQVLLREIDGSEAVRE